MVKFFSSALLICFTCLPFSVATAVPLWQPMTAMAAGDPAARFSVAGGNEAGLNSDSTAIEYFQTTNCATSLGAAIANGGNFRFEIGQVWAVNGDNIYSIGAAEPPGATIPDMTIVNSVHVVPRNTGTPVFTSTPCFQVTCSAVDSNCSYSGAAVSVDVTTL